jgi:hypothetical protein
VIRSLYTNADARSVLLSASRPLPDALARWLGALTLLENVPFNAIVPDARMLPHESIRFFFVDRNWIDALLDGALSILSSFDEHHAQAAALLREHVHARARRMALVERRRRLLARRRIAAEVPEPPDQPDVPVTGFLMRSVAVQNWPGLRVRAFTDREAKDPIDPLRIARVSPTVLLALFGKRAQRFDIAMPAGALCFGVEKAANETLRVPLRGLGGAIASGEQITGAYQQVMMRADVHGRRVLDIAGTHAALVTTLKAAYQPAECPPVDSGAFAIEMVAGSQSQSFYNGAPIEETDGRA